MRAKQHWYLTGSAVAADILRNDPNIWHGIKKKKVNCFSLLSFPSLELNQNKQFLWFSINVCSLYLQWAIDTITNICTPQHLESALVPACTGGFLQHRRQEQAPVSASSLLHCWGLYSAPELGMVLVLHGNPESVLPPNPAKGRQGTSFSCAPLPSVINTNSLCFLGVAIR